MAKIVLVGAGSYKFAKDIIMDIFLYPEIRDSTVALVDIDKDRLELAAAFARKLVEQNKFKTKIEATTDRRKALDGADYVIISIRAGGWEPFLNNRKAGLKRGIEASPDALGTGGVFTALRQIPAVLDICHDMEELCPDAWLLNYSNPMAMICWAVNDYSRIKSVGLCPNPRGAAGRIARWADVPFEEMYYTVAGINHFSWYLDVKWQGKDLYPLLREKFKDPDEYMKPGFLGKDVRVDPIAIEIFRNFGYFESAFQHITMFVPYFRRTPVLSEKYKVDDFGPIFGQAPKRTADDDAELKKQLASGYKFPVTTEYRWSRHAIDIIHSMETGTLRRIDGNVKNNGLITNLLQGCVVEVPCLVDKGGIHPCYIGDLPAQCAALDRANISEQELAVRGIVEKDKKKIFQAMLVDPLTSSVLTMDETREMVEEMFKIDKPFLKGFKSIG